jgi:hypothetical protein
MFLLINAFISFFLYGYVNELQGYKTKECLIELSLNSTSYY